MFLKKIYSFFKKNFQRALEFFKNFFSWKNYTFFTESGIVNRVRCTVFNRREKNKEGTIFGKITANLEGKICAHDMVFAEIFPSSGKKRENWREFQEQIHKNKNFSQFSDGLILVQGK